MGWKTLVVLLGVGLATAQQTRPEKLLRPEQICELRCLANCLAFLPTSSQDVCQQKCNRYRNPALCSNATCWSRCRDMTPDQLLPAPTNLHVVNGTTQEIQWDPVPGAIMYVVFYKDATAPSFNPDNFVVSKTTKMTRFSPPRESVCSSIDMIVAALSEDGIGVLSSPVRLPEAKPVVNSKLQLLETRYIDRPYVNDLYEANGTIQVTFQYEENFWPLGDEDLDAVPLFHLVTCAEPDLSQSFPLTSFVKGKQPQTLVGLMGADMMYRKCRFVYYLQSVKSRKCGTENEMHSPPPTALQTMTIDCDSVVNAPCMSPPIFDHPACGQVDILRYSVLTPNYNLDNVNQNLTINVTFVPMVRANEPPTLYYVGIYGEAVAYRTKEEETFLGVNITRVKGNVSSCLQFAPNGVCQTATYNNSLVLEGIHPKQMYGITICAIKDPRNVTLPDVITESRTIKPKANRIIISNKAMTKLDQFLTTNAPPVESTLHSPIPHIGTTSESSLSVPPTQLIFIGYATSSTTTQKTTRVTATPEFTHADVDADVDVELDQEDFSLSGKENDTRFLIKALLRKRRHSNLRELTVVESSTVPCNESNSCADDCTTSNCTDPCAYYLDNGTYPIDSNSTFNSENCTSTTEAVEVTSTSTVEDGSNHVGLIIGVVIGSLILLAGLAAAVVFYMKMKHRKQERLYKLKLAQIEKDNHNRYTMFPKKHDIWEIERRNLIIHNDKKLGSGAFGAVYLGRLIGKSLGHKDANSPLGVNLMRAENCQVAVKMLPEYADDMSKSEFLREISLMKSLGFHERLVNMLACITDSEPLCLVVEYCSDGDLLHFLRERCKYMMKLDDLGINYQEAPENNNYDIDMIVTLKLLLQFAVQISYGLEYLSQKGFVHRDVAARNVLVHEGNTCKIGDFGLCRYIYADAGQYKSKGGRLPLKWMSPEAIRHYEFSIQSDVWSFGILLFEIITLGGSPYPCVAPEDVLHFLEDGGRIEQPDNCPDNFYEVMLECWRTEPEERPEFSDIRMKLASQLEEITEDYSYLKLDAARDYYNVQYGDQKADVIILPDDDGGKTELSRKPSRDSLPVDGSIDGSSRHPSLEDSPKERKGKEHDFDSISLDIHSLNGAYKLA